MTSTETPQAFLTTEWLDHYLGHRRLTRKTIDAFPEEAFFNYTIAGMRTPAAILGELLALGAPGLRQIATGNVEALNEHISFTSKAEVLRLWDEATEEIERTWQTLTQDDFRKDLLSFGMYPGTGWSTVLYFIENEVHHRGQLYVYLRSLGIEPPAFWDR